MPTLTKPRLAGRDVTARAALTTAQQTVAEALAEVDAAQQAYGVARRAHRDVQDRVDAIKGRINQIASERN